MTDAVTGKRATVDTGGNLRVATANPNAIPTNQFSVSPLQIFAAYSGSPLIQPDPSGTRYAISSFTATNTGSSAINVQLAAVAATDFDAGCVGISNGVKTVLGPVVLVGPNSTVSLSFSNPMSSDPPGRTSACPVIGAAPGGSTWSVVGRKI